MQSIYTSLATYYDVQLYRVYQGCPLLWQHGLKWFFKT